MPDFDVRSATFAELDASTLYALMRLRVDVFVVEQECPYPDLDGLDAEPQTRHLWIEGDAGEPVAYLRLLAESEGHVRISRVVTAKHDRGKGYAGRLMQAAMQRVADWTAHLHAQTYAAGFYARYGFVADGEEFVEDGIPHVLMTHHPTPI